MISNYFALNRKRFSENFRCLHLAHSIYYGFINRKILFEVKRINKFLHFSTHSSWSLPLPNLHMQLVVDHYLMMMTQS